MSYRICYASPDGVAHCEHSGGLTFCGRESGWYDGQLHRPTMGEALGYMNTIRSCRRCRASLERRVHERQRRTILNATSVSTIDLGGGRDDDEGSHRATSPH